MRTLCALCFLFIAAATSAGAQVTSDEAAPASTSTPATAPAPPTATRVDETVAAAVEPAPQPTAVTVDRRAAEEALAAATTAQGALQSVDLTAIAPAIEEACRAATQGLTTARATVGNTDQLKKQIEAIQQALGELRASGELSAAGATKIEQLLEKLAVQPQGTQVYTLSTPLAQALPSLPQGMHVYTLPAPMALELKEKLQSLPELQQRLQGLKIDTEKLEQALKALENQPGIDKLSAEKLAQLKQLSATGGARYYTLGQNGKRGVLILRLQDDGTLDLSGPGYTDEELQTIREQLNSNRGLAELLKKRAVEKAAP